MQRFIFITSLLLFGIEGKLKSGFIGGAGSHDSSPIEG
ncbi:hypothetical protein CAEBREN_28052 [Caenorhabditis brenneri]|uniref:Uncharacterized protein n=1 Tax=Caenorhabditis brenneri TaxID=135651 RepID=G0NCC5_CAEBE|nr:hypothetical protein CAEBREN_28052 [Caenorhabditis brenneri]